MCGIVFLIAPKKLKKKINEIGKNSLSKLKHRGPDDFNEISFDFKFSDKKNEEIFSIFCGHTVLRISTEDESDSTQPAVSENQNSIMLFNGEIYNHIELAKNINSSIKQSDTANILEIIEKKGMEFFHDNARGMWSIISINKGLRRIIFSRDHFGQRPLFYSKFQIDGEEVIIFCSEIKGIKSIKEIKLTYDKEISYLYLLNGMIDFNEKTIYKEILQVKPGHHGLIKPNLEIVQHYRDLFSNNNGTLKEKLINSINLQKPGNHIKPALLLSAGVDSSTICYLTHKIHNKYKFDLVSYGNTDRESEAKSAKLFSKEYLPGRKHKIYSFPAKIKLKELIELHACLDQPSDNSGIMAVYRLYKALKKDGYKVVLGGESNDETSLGYYDYYAGRYLRDSILKFRIRKFFPFMFSKKILRSAIGHIIKTNFYSSKFFDKKFKFLYKNIEKNYKNLLLDAFEENIKWQKVSLKDISRKDLQKYNIPKIMRLNDHMAMHHSIETRYPFLDKEYIIESWKINPQEKLGTIGRGKESFRKILKEIYNNKIPNQLDSKKTTGFGQNEQENWYSIELEEYFLKNQGILKEIGLKLKSPIYLSEIYKMDIWFAWRLISLLLIMKI